ncbi:MAG: hypothetical protein LC768_03530 [Acidobacteria bacterium]|nr:hypothetical protein [Acidobacteriota bacterium]MCA1637398.1 hypothetical protein [Acidobacteriota bacterium]
MPIEVNVGQLLAGYTARDVLEGEEATLITRELVTDDKEKFRIFAEEGIPKALLASIPEEKRKELLPVETMVAVMKRDLTATLYLNTIPDDLVIFSDAVPKRLWNPGEEITIDDIADLKRLNIKI